MKLLENIKHSLNNENGGPNVEYLVGIGAALAIGSGLFLFGTAVYNWFDGPASATIEDIGLPDEDDWFI